MNAVQNQGADLETDNKAGTAMERSNLYGFLAAVFRAEPTAELIAEIRKAPFRDALKAVGADLTESLGGDSDKELLDDLAIEYVRLFLGPGRHIAPYAAVYLGGGASLWGPETAWVKTFIEDSGFDYKADFHDLPDHIAVELEFMREITARQARALDKDDEEKALDYRRREIEFLTKHLARWVPEFCRKVEADAQYSFYGEMARLTKDFIRLEAEEAEAAG